MAEKKIVKTVWITKYALTQGIFKLEDVEIEEILEGSTRRGFQAGTLIAKKDGKEYWGNDVHFTEQSAMKREEDLLLEKSDSLRKTLSILNKRLLEIDEWFIINGTAENPPKGILSRKRLFVPQDSLNIKIVRERR